MNFLTLMRLAFAGINLSVQTYYFGIPCHLDKLAKALMFPCGSIIGECMDAIILA